MTGTFLISYHSGVSLEKSQTLAVLMLAGVSIVILFKVSLPLTPFKVVLGLIMSGIITLAFVTPIGRMIFSLSKINLHEWLISGAVIIASIPVLALVVSLIRTKKHIEK